VIPIALKSLAQVSATRGLLFAVDFDRLWESLTAENECATKRKKRKRSKTSHRWWTRGDSLFNLSKWQYGYIYITSL